jgi:hypothetical protein
MSSSCSAQLCTDRILPYLIFSDEERDEEGGVTADGDREREERSGSEKADSDHEEEAEKSDASPKEGSDGGLFYSVINWRDYKHFIKFQCKIIGSAQFVTCY